MAEAKSRNRGLLCRGGNREGLRAGSGGVAFARLLPGGRGLGSEVEGAATESDTRQASLAGELARGIGGGNADEGIELLHQESGRGFPYEVLGGDEQHAAEGPQAESVKAGRFWESVEAAAMGIADEVGDCLQSLRATVRRLAARRAGSISGMQATDLRHRSSTRESTWN